jgi:hypothetical protein
MSKYRVEQVEDYRNQAYLNAPDDFDCFYGSAQLDYWAYDQKLLTLWVETRWYDQHVFNRNTVGYSYKTTVSIMPETWRMLDYTSYTVDKAVAQKAHERAIAGLIFDLECRSVSMLVLIKTLLHESYSQLE